MNRTLIKMLKVLVQITCMFIICSFFTAIQTESIAAQSDISLINEEMGTQEEKKQDGPWEPLSPTPDKFDWIQLNSGEWLKGELKVLYEEKIEFESDELDLLILDWADVKQVRGHRPFSVRFEGPTTVDGLLEVNGDDVFVTVEGTRQKFQRNQLLAIAPGETKEINYWSGKLSLGLTFISGNSDQTQYSATGDIQRRTSATRFVTDYLGNYTRTEDIETVNNHRINSYFDVFRTRKYFLRPISGEYYRDPFKNIEHRVTIGTGIGYHIIDNPKTEWDVSGGPAYQWTRFDSVEAGQDQSDSTLALVAGTHFNTALTKRVDFDFLYNFQIISETSGTYNHHIVAAFETELTKLLDFDISFVWDRTQDPQPSEDGTVPEKDDFYLIFGLGIEF